MKKNKLKERIKKGVTKLSGLIKKYSSIGISDSIENIVELFFEGIRNSSNAFWYLFLAILVFPFIILLLVILLTKKLIVNFFEYIANFFKSFYKVINYLYKVIKEILIKIYNFIKTWFIIAIGEIKFYFLKIEMSSKELKQAWKAILIFFVNYLSYLSKKIFNDHLKFTNQPVDGYSKLFRDFILAPFIWGIWLSISLPMILILTISSIIVFPPLLHRAIRIGFSANPQEVYSQESFDIESIEIIDLTVEQPLELNKLQVERPDLKDIVYTIVGTLILSGIIYIYMNNAEFIFRKLDNTGEWIYISFQEPINVDDFVIENGDFEKQESINWSKEPNDYFDWIYGTVKINDKIEEPFRGEGMAILFNRGTEISTISQLIPIPNIWKPSLRFYYKVISEESTCSGNRVTVIAEIPDSYDTKKTELWSKALCKDSFSEQWELQSINLRHYRGSTIKLSFIVKTTDSSTYNRLFLLDEVNLDLGNLTKRPRTSQ